MGFCGTRSRPSSGSSGGGRWGSPDARMPPPQLFRNRGEDSAAVSLECLELCRYLIFVSDVILDLPMMTSIMSHLPHKHGAPSIELSTQFASCRNHDSTCILAKWLALVTIFPFWGIGMAFSSSQGFRRCDSHVTCGDLREEVVVVQRLDYRTTAFLVIHVVGHGPRLSP